MKATPPVTLPEIVTSTDDGSVPARDVKDDPEPEQDGAGVTHIRINRRPPPTTAG